MTVQRGVFTTIGSTRAGQRGGFVVGLIVGLLVGLAIALGVAWARLDRMTGTTKDYTP